MRLILYAFLELALLRRLPQSLPPATGLLAVALLSHWVSGLLISLTSLPLGQALLAAVYGSLITVGFVALVLYPLGRSPRFQQTATALLGGESVIGFVAVPIILWGESGSAGSELAALLSLGVVIWNLFFAAALFRQALSDGEGSGLLWALLYMSASLVLSTLLPTLF